MPARVVENWRAWWPWQYVRALADVHRRVEDAAAVWGLSDLRLMEGGEVAVVFACEARRWGPCVAKFMPAVAEVRSAGDGEARALREWSASGLAPEVFSVADGGLTILMERAEGGDSLRDACRDPLETMRVLGSVAAGLHAEVPRDGFPLLRESELVERWRDALGGYREGRELDALLRRRGEPRLLHLDLHAGNVLRDGERWIAIDPKPHLGDRHADVYGFLDGAPLATLPTSPGMARRYARDLLATYAKASGLSAGRTAKWVRVRAVATAVPELGGTHEAWARKLLWLASALT